MIRFKSDGLIRNFRISRSCHSTTNQAHCSTKNFNRCPTVIEIYFMFIILGYVYVARAYTLASTVRAIVQYCLRVFPSSTQLLWQSAENDVNDNTLIRFD